MISYLRGTIAYIEKEKAVIDVNGIGYGVIMPSTSLNRMNSNKEITVYTYLSVKEDAVQLFGFLTRDELNIFKLLITVNGIGPKGAVGILSAVNPDELRLAIVAGDIKAICLAPGIGKKTAQKLILELKDKISIEDTFEHMAEEKALSENLRTENTDLENEAFQALMALGYSNSEAMKAVRSVPKTDGMTVEDLLKQSLKYMTF